MTDNKIAFGLPVKGDVGHYSLSPKEQWPIEKLEPFIAAMLADESIHEFGWIQFTPYFNDGDPCVFSVGPAFVIPKDEISKDDEDFYRWDHEVRYYPFGDEPKSPDHHIEFDKQLQSGHFDVALEQMFGDPAEVVISKTGITVEFYDHD